MERAETNLLKEEQRHVQLNAFVPLLFASTRSSKAFSDKIEATRSRGGVGETLVFVGRID